MPRSKKEIEELMSVLLEGLAEDLLKRLQEGNMTPQDMSNAIKLLKDNGITVEVKKGTAMSILSEELPFHTDNAEVQ